MIIIIKYYIRMHAAGIQDLAYSTRWNGTEKVKGLIFFFFFFFFNSRNLFHFSSFTRWFVWHMGRTCPDGLLAVLSTSSKRAKRLSHYEIFFWKGGPTTTFSNPLLPSPRVFCFLSGEMGNNWNFHPHEMAIKRAKKERKNKRREREMERYTELERRENAVWLSRTNKQEEEEELAKAEKRETTVWEFPHQSNRHSQQYVY